MFAEVPFLPQQASNHAASVDALFFLLLGVTAFFTLLISTLVIFFTIKYRRRSEDEWPPGFEGSLRLELAWTLIPLAIALFIFYWGTDVYFAMCRPPDDAMQVYVVGRRWMWHAQHADGQREINRLHVPLGRAVKVTLTSEDVIHGFYVPDFRVNQDAVPGRYSTTWFRPTKLGTFKLFCTQYCGTDHSIMIGDVVVMEPSAFQAWLSAGADNSAYTEGRKLFQKLQCVTCHNASPQAKAPLLEGIWDPLTGPKRVVLQDGSQVLADDAYLRESILVPDAKVVAGYQPIMPSFAGQVNEREILQLFTFLKHLGPGQTPPRVEDAEAPAVAVPREKSQEKSKEKEQGKRP